MSADNTGSDGPEQSVRVDIVPPESVPQDAGMDGAAAQNGSKWFKMQGCPGFGVNAHCVRAPSAGCYKLVVVPGRDARRRAGPGHALRRSRPIPRIRRAGGAASGSSARGSAFSHGPSSAVLWPAPRPVPQPRASGQSRDQFHKFRTAGGSSAVPQFRQFRSSAVPPTLSR